MRVVQHITRRQEESPETSCILGRLKNILSKKIWVNKLYILIICQYNVSYKLILCWDSFESTLHIHFVLIVRSA